MNELRLLSEEEMMTVGGGLSICPIDEWWNPNWLTDDAGLIQTMPALNGPYGGYYKSGTLWCLYDHDNNLVGVYQEDPAGTTTLYFTSVTEVDNTTLTGINMMTTTGGGYTVSLSPVH